MKRSVRVFWIFCVMTTIFIGTKTLLYAQTPPIVYVAGDGSGDYNCDGTNDHEEINQALQFVANNSEYTTVYLKGPNTFWISEPIVMPSGTKLKGDASAVVQLVDYAVWPNNKPMIRQEGEPHWGPDGDLGEALLGSDFDYVSDIEISGFEVTGGKNDDKTVGQYYVILILFYKAHNIKIHDMTLSKSRGDTIRIFNGEDVDIYNNWMKETGHESVYFKYVTNVNIYDNEMYVSRANDAIRAEHCGNLDIHGNIIKNSLERGPNGYAGVYIESGSLVPLGYCEIYDNVIFAKCSGLMIKSELGDKRVKDIHIHHNIFYKILFRRDHLHGGIHLMGVHNTLIEFNTFDQCEHDAIIYEWGKHEGEEPGYETIVRNNIITNSERYGINDLTDSRHTFICEYNDIYNSGEGDYNNASSTTDIHVDPLYAHNTGTDPDAIDLHLKSQEGRWDGTNWVNDALISPCIDAGDPAEDFSFEPAPNGARVNMGAYGNTAYASKKSGDGINKPPIADAGPDLEVFDTDTNGSEQVTLDASDSSDPDGTITSYEWNFGDGQTGSGETVVHTYPTGSTHTAILTVTDNDGVANTDTVRITVNKSYYQLTYTAGSNGSITGNTSQTVAHGSDASEVTAVPNTGYYFVIWSDGVTTASRTDTNVVADINVTASFAEDGAGILYDSPTNSFIISGFSSTTPCTLEDIYVYDQANGPLNKITRKDKGSYYEYTLNSTLNVGKDASSDTYFQMGHNTDNESKYNDEVLIITGNIVADKPSSGHNSYITIGSETDNTLNPKIEFNCSSDLEFYIGRTCATGHTNYYNCTLESYTGKLYAFGGDLIVAKSDQALVNVTLRDHQSGYWSDFRSTCTMSNCTLNTHGEQGYWLGHTPVLVADNINVTGNNWGIYGVHYSDMTITNSSFTSIVEEAVYTARDHNVKIASTTINVLGSRAYAMRLEAATDGIRYIRDSSLTNRRSDQVLLLFECYEADGDDIASLEATNITYNSDTRTEYVEDAGTLHIDRNFYLDVKVENANGNPIQGATVSVTSSDGGEINTGYATGVWELGANSAQTTGTNGHTPLPSTGNSFILRDYRRTSTAKTQYTYTITVSKDGYNTVELTGVNPDNTWYRTDPDAPQNTQTIVLTSNGSIPHSADTNSDWSISQAEVSSFITSYNNNNNTVATANGDITPERITMREVLRVIYLYNNNGAYVGGQATVDTYDISGSGGDAGAPPPSAGNTITVANSADSGIGSLRNAIANAAYGDTITFDESVSRITLANEIVIDKSITIDGNGIVIVSGDSKTRIFQIHNGDEEIFVSLLNMGIVDANNSVDEFGGAIYNNEENLVLENCLFNNNTNSTANGKGGAVYTSGNLTVNNCEFTENSAKEENDIYSISSDNVIME